MAVPKPSWLSLTYFNIDWRVVRSYSLMCCVHKRNLCQIIFKIMFSVLLISGWSTCKSSFSTIVLWPRYPSRLMRNAIFRLWRCWASSTPNSPTGYPCRRWTIYPNSKYSSWWDAGLWPLHHNFILLTSNSAPEKSSGGKNAITSLWLILKIQRRQENSSKNSQINFFSAKNQISGDFSGFNSSKIPKSLNTFA